jgi:hypothetical protein
MQDVLNPIKQIKYVVLVNYPKEKNKKKLLLEVYQ